eukprot:COSAG05_NODE_4499_length_1488_cov_1.714183_2_plen_79_part_00
MLHRCRDRLQLWLAGRSSCPLCLLGAALHGSAGAGGAMAGNGALLPPAALEAAEANAAPPLLLRLAKVGVFSTFWFGC